MGASSRDFAAETDLALLCNIDDKKHWIPKSVVHEDSEVSSEGDTRNNRASALRDQVAERGLL